MRLEKRFLVKQKNGIIIPYEPRLYHGNINKFGNKDFWIEFRNIYKQRSIQENRYLFGCVIKILVEQTEYFGGWESIEAYRWLEWFFLNNWPDKKPKKWVSVKDLSTVDFEALMERIREYAPMEWGCIIPEPNEVDLVGEVIF